MIGKLYLSLLSGLSLLSSSNAFAHIDTSREGAMSVLAHFIASPDHLPMLVFIGIAVAYFVRKQRQQDD